MSDDEDDEFDELFSFSTATTLKARASPIHFDISDNDATNDDLKIEESICTSTQTNDDSSSFADVSPIESNIPQQQNGDVRDDDVFGDFDLNAIHLKGNEPDFVEDDFHAMDADTREMLDFLEHEPTGSVSNVLQDAKKFLDLNLEDDDDMEFIEIKVHGEGVNKPSTATEVTSGISIDNGFSKQGNCNIDEPETSLAKESIQRSPYKEKTESPSNRETSKSDTPYLNDSNTELLEESGSTLSHNTVDANHTLSQKKNENEIFNSLTDAILSSTSSMNQIRQLLFLNTSDIRSISAEERPYLWTKAICSKTLDEVEQSSLADSFSSWYESLNFDFLQSKDDLCGFGLSEVFMQRILDEVDALIPRILRQGVDEIILKRNLCSVMIYYYRSIALSKSLQLETPIETKMKSAQDDLAFKEEITENLEQSADSSSDRIESKTPNNRDHVLSNADVEWNPLIGPIITMLLMANMAAPVTNVMLSRILPTFMPLVSLSQEERILGAKSLHQAFYYLISYHLPLLVLHLDRHTPGWFWPASNDGNTNDNDLDEDAIVNKEEILKSRGLIPVYWFTTMFVGEGTEEWLNTSNLTELWDILLASNDNSLKFFLALAILESHSDHLLTLKGQDLVEEVKAVTSFQNNGPGEASFFGNSQAGRTSVQVWYSNAKMLQEATPESVIIEFRKAEDYSLQRALAYRSKLAMDGMKARLEAEAEAHRRAVEEENAKQLIERMEKYYRDRLLNFYKKNCPEKVQSIDKIMEVYHNRYEELDAKLHAKYGSGFLPLVSIFNPKVASQTSKLFSSVGHGIEMKKKNLIAARAEERSRLLGEFWNETQRKHQVAVKVSVSDVLPVICGNKMAKAEMGANEYFKFYLVDSRTLECRKIQGSFPTAASLTPEDLMEPELIQEKVEMFESLRGAAHIVVMGEGFSAFPSLYDHPLDKNEERLLDNDESRTNMCALFFIKKGFPFVSVLDGGFAAAHAWLKRDCLTLSISKVLVDYDEETSPFADLERSYQEQKEYLNASARKKTTLTMQRFIDNSMARLASAEKSIEDFTNRSHIVNEELIVSSIEDSTIENKKEDIKTGIKNVFVGIKKRRSHADPNLDNTETDEAKGFDMKKLTFGRKDKNLIREKKGSFFSKRKSEDESLENEVTASLRPNERGEPNETHMTSRLHKLKFGLGKSIPSSDGKNIKDTIKGISFKRTNENSKSLNPSSAILEEESILFED